eukprot:TRINITY_DN4597_c0_g3_i1.p1 TRINITY_DN4597_c0_g3~~TRINITY_DN4597_c0_g3_i1.p1  ORF type:complete len:124 (-),score=14.70 TRINITY_DN4597_c0_g3_i1:421-792(-)
MRIVMSTAVPLGSLLLHLGHSVGAVVANLVEGLLHLAHRPVNVRSTGRAFAGDVLVQPVRGPQEEQTPNNSAKEQSRGNEDRAEKQQQRAEQEEQEASNDDGDSHNRQRHSDTNRGTNPVPER